MKNQLRNPLPTNHQDRCKNVTKMMGRTVKSKASNNNQSKDFAGGNKNYLFRKRREQNHGLLI